jgi:hypothetical protein
MTTLMERLSELVASFGPALIVKATVILLATLAVVALARRCRASVRHLLLAAAHAVLLALPISRSPIHSRT